MAALTILLRAGNSVPLIGVDNLGTSGAVVEPRIAGVAITAGQVVADSTAGTLVLASSASTGTLPCQPLGIALQAAGAGQAVDVVREGLIAGYDLSSLAYGAIVYLNDTAGVAGTAAGTVSVPLGRVVGTSQKDSSGNPTKALKLFCNPCSSF